MNMYERILVTMTSTKKLNKTTNMNGLAMRLTKMRTLGANMLMAKPTRHGPMVMNKLANMRNMGI